VLALSALQSSILARVAAHVRPGGRLVFAVCSVLREEAEDVLARIDLAGAGLGPAPFAGEAAKALFGDSSSGRLLPHVHGTDGYFLASFERPTK
jgi:16S rRNA (cytosine967-C5)-methyltransferase